MESPSFNRHRHRNLPEEIVIEILSRLPIESLLRFKCVSKVWRSWISDPKFTLSSSQRHLQIAFQSGDFYSVDTGEASSSNVLLRKPIFFIDNKKKGVWWHCVKNLGSCNGFLLVSYYADLYLWNPTTRQSTKLLSIQTDLHYINAKSGLCYDSNSDDYKAVLVNHGLVTIVSFKRKYWATKACTFANEDDGDKLYSGPVVNEKLHWVVSRFANGKFYIPTANSIVYFDPFTNEFVELPMPVVHNNGEHSSVIPLILGVGVLEGCLCMAYCVCERDDEVEYDYMWEDVALKINFIELLVMKEHGVGESWTSAFIMSNNVGDGLNALYPVYGSLEPLCFTKNGEVLFSVHGIKLLAYNPDEMSQREISLNMRHCNSYEALYVESLASPERHCNSYEALYVETLASPDAYGQEEDWIMKTQDALHLLDWVGRWDTDSWSDYDYSDWDFLNFSEEDSSIEEDDAFVVSTTGFLEKENNKEKFVKKEKAWRYFLSTTEKKRKAHQRIRDKRKITQVRKNQQKKKQETNIEVEDLHKEDNARASNHSLGPLSLVSILLHDE